MQACRAYLRSTCTDIANPVCCTNVLHQLAASCLRHDTPGRQQALAGALALGWGCAAGGAGRH
jgi:hypothetical protein